MLFHFIRHGKSNEGKCLLVLLFSRRRDHCVRCYFGTTCLEMPFRLILASFTEVVVVAIVSDPGAVLVGVEVL